MRYPRLVANQEALVYNAKTLITMCHNAGVEVVAVAKVFCGDPKFAKLFLELGADMIGDSRVDNILKMRAAGIKGPFMLLRIPMISEIVHVVENVDVVMVSDVTAVKILGEEARKRAKTQKIVYMVDMGDLREGVWYENAVDEVVEVSRVDGVELYGIGTNLGCCGGVIPDAKNMSLLADIADKIGERGVKLKIVSGGSTAALHLIENHKLPGGVNGFRIGESLVLGTDVTNNRVFPFLRQDTFTLWAETIEIKVKPSVPCGDIGRDAMGRVPLFQDLGKRLRAIIAIGEQDAPSNGLEPLDKGIRVLHASSDHTILDITDLKSCLKVGDVLGFRLTYSALLRAMTSEYVEKGWR